MRSFTGKGAARQDAGRRMAALCQYAGVPGLHVWPSGEEAALYGQRSSGKPGMELGSASWNGGCWTMRFIGSSKTICAALNALYRSEPALYEIDFQGGDSNGLIFTMPKFDHFVHPARQEPEDYLVFVCNFTPTPHMSYRIGMPEAGGYREIFNSDAAIFGGSNLGNGGYVTAEPSVPRTCGFRFGGDSPAGSRGP